MTKGDLFARIPLEFPDDLGGVVWRIPLEFHDDPRVTCRFDSELRKVSEHLREEKQQRDKLQREKDELAASKYSLEQELKRNWIDPERELLELSSHGNKDDKEDRVVMTGQSSDGRTEKVMTCIVEKDGRTEKGMQYRVVMAGQKQ
ncbi:hypothetical protein NP493_876g00024 [Ridgeia piscesae]|uniref:Uncharacterized protein n=1 Tax=Ridgeia piscesae TaxID=27915 RepID=A0AAD9NNB6_RIDPI|nr:hypothetical protein NP493_876g00024 [Ridgeia piscesae]